MGMGEVRMRLFEKKWKEFVEEADPDMEEYLEKHPYMEMDGLQEAGTAGMASHLKPENRHKRSIARAQWLLDQYLSGWEALKRLGAGASGEVFMIQDNSTGQRLALKLVHSGNSNMYDLELKAYEWVRVNRSGLPEDIKKYLPMIYGVMEAPVGDHPDNSKGDKVLMIAMELLKDLPRQVVSDLFQVSLVKPSISKEERVLSDYESIQKVVSYTVFKSSILRQLLSNVVGLAGSRDLSGIEVLEQIETKALEMFYTDSVPSEYVQFANRNSPNWGSESDYKHQRDSNFNYPRRDPSKKVSALVGAILYHAVDMLDEEGKVLGLRQSTIARSLAKDLGDMIQWKIGQRIVPIEVGFEDSNAQHDAAMSDKFPEAKNIVNAINKLQDERQVKARDIHHRNVMMRPETGDFVIMDLGLFLIGS